MKCVVIRESAIRSCLATKSSSGPKLLLDICNEAITGTHPDFASDDWKYYDKETAKCLYEAIAPDIVASVTEEVSPNEAALDAITYAIDTIEGALGRMEGEGETTVVPVPIPVDKDGEPIGAEVFVEIRPDDPIAMEESRAIEKAE